METLGTRVKAYRFSSFPQCFFPNSSFLFFTVPGSGLGDLHFFGVAMLLLFLHKLHMVLMVGKFKC